MISIEIELTPELFAALTIRAQTDRIDINELGRQAISAYLHDSSALKEFHLGPK